MFSFSIVQAEQVNPTFQPAIKIAQSKTVKIYGAKLGRTVGYGTGILVSNEGHILTISGVYLSGEKIRVVLEDGSLHEATIVRRSLPLQLALLKIDHKPDNYFDLNQQSDPPQQGDWALAISNAFRVAEGREKLSVNLGVVSLRTKLQAKRGVQDSLYEGDMLLVDSITSNPGAAGGPMVDAKGNLIGVIGKLMENTHTGTRLNFAIPSDQLKLFMDEKPLIPVEPIANEGPAELGIRVFALAGKTAAPYVDRVLPNSPASKLGIKPDDLILELGTDRIRTVRDFQNAIKKLKSGEKITVRLKRKNEILSFQAELPLN